MRTKLFVLILKILGGIPGIFAKFFLKPICVGTYKCVGLFYKFGLIAGKKSGKVLYTLIGLLFVILVALIFRR